jgi:hypothetical protein
MARVRKPDGEQTFAGSRGNDEVAPTPDLRAVAPERGGSLRVSDVGRATTRGLSRERPARPAVLKARIAFLTFTPFNSLSSDASDTRMADS